MFYLVIISNTASFIIPETQNNIEKTIENIGFIFHIVYFTQTDFPAKTLDRTFSVLHDEQTIYVDFHRSHPDTLLCFDAGLQRSGHSVYGGKIHAMQSWNDLGLCGFLSLLLFLRRKLSRKVVGLLGVLLDLVVVHFLAPLVLLHDPLQLVLREVTLQPEPRPHYCRRCRCAVRL